MWRAKYEETEEEGWGVGTRGRAGRACRNHRIFSLQMRKVRPREQETAGRGTWYLDPQAGTLEKEVEIRKERESREEGFLKEKDGLLIWAWELRSPPTLQTL